MKIIYIYCTNIYIEIHLSLDTHYRHYACLCVRACVHACVCVNLWGKLVLIHRTVFFVDVSKDYFIFMCSYLCQLSLCNPLVFALSDLLNVFEHASTCSALSDVLAAFCI